MSCCLQNIRLPQWIYFKLTIRHLPAVCSDVLVGFQLVQSQLVLLGWPMVCGGLDDVSHTKIGTHLKPHLSQATPTVNIMSCQETWTTPTLEAPPSTRTPSHRANRWLWCTSSSALWGDKRPSKLATHAWSWTTLSCMWWLLCSSSAEKTWLFKVPIPLHMSQCVSTGEHRSITSLASLNCFYNFLFWPVASRRCNSTSLS